MPLLRISLFLALLLLLSSVAGCAFLKKREEPSSEKQLTELAKKPLSPDETKALLSDVGENWLYGEGLGSSVLTVGTIALFPPYAIYVLGNSALSLTGYEELRVSNMLPDEERAQWNGVYEQISSGPGRLAAAVAGKEYRDKERSKAVLKRYTEKQKKEQVSPSDYLSSFSD